MQDDRFRSISAFKDFEQRRRGAPETLSVGAEVTPTEVSPLKVLARLKQSATGLSRVELARELGADTAGIDDAVLRLVKEDLVAVEPWGEDERVVAR